MALMDFIKKQFIDVIGWTEQSDGVLAYRFPMQDMEIQNGAQLTVRDSQVAVFVNEGVIADVLGPGLHTLNTRTLPLLTNLKNWDKLFASPFKSDVYFFSTRLQLDRKWGTPTPITIRDKDFGAVRMRAFGIYSYKIADAGLFYKEVSGTREAYTVADVDGQLRNTVIAALTAAFGSSNTAFLDMAGNQGLLADQVKKQMEPMFARMGLALDTMVVENVSLPEEIQKQLDTRIGMNMIGDMNRYTQYQTANAIPIAAANEGGGLAGLGANFAVGMGIGNQMAGSMGALNQQQPPPAGGAPGGAAAGGPAPAPAPAGGNSEVDDVMATLEKLHGLVGKGIITQQEFDTKKSELLKKLS
ncbi:MAG TPA: SPFH domain-containing protein [Burkholderiales bacterium]|jgi:membrane protease subunit (stomatin/prohibitin family)